jgi:tetratricopeptide (TPR) repeat protein
MKRLGRYELIRTLGRGGRGRAFEAILHGPGGFRKHVALKLLDDGRAAIVREARLGGLIQHPNVVGVYAVGEHEGVWYLAMELVPGGTLAEAGALPPDAVVDVAIQVCEGLHHLHVEGGLVHLDVKPANLLLDRAIVKVADLGEAVRIGQPGRGGTPAYMSPEHRAREPVTARSDVWSLGVVLNALATGTPSADPTRVSWLQPVLERCLAVDPADRFATTADLAEALEALDIEGPGYAAWQAARQSPPSTMALEPTIRTNLLRPAREFVGRDSDIAAIRQALQASRQVTLHGPAGIGKSTLAAHIGRELVAGGLPVFQAGFGETDGEASMEAVVARAMGVPVGRRGLGPVLADLGDLMLVLDELESVQQAAQTLVASWLEAAPRLRVLCTSRHAASSGRTVTVGPLSEGDAQRLLSSLASRTLDPAHARTLANRLDRIPLALEMVAPRLRVLTCRQMLERLPSLKKRALATALDSSWALLSEPLRRAVTQLSVLVADFSVASAAAVLDRDVDDALDLIQALMEQAWLTEHAGDEVRFAMFDAVRDYANGRLSEPERTQATLRHATHFAALGTAAAIAANRTRGGVSTYLGELPNLAAACRRAVARGDGPTAAATAMAVMLPAMFRGPYGLAVELLSSALTLEFRAGELGARLGELLGRIGRPTEALEVLERSVATGHVAARAPLADLLLWTGRPDDALEALGTGPVPPALRGQFAMTEGAIREDLGQIEAAERLLRQALHAGRRHADPATLAAAAVNLGAFLHHSGQLAEARALYELGRATHGALGAITGKSTVLQNLGLLARAEGDAAAARDHLAQALALARSIGDVWCESSALRHMGLIELEAGELEAAAETMERARALCQELGDVPGEAAVLTNLGNVHGERGDTASALEALQASLALHRAASNRRGAAIALANVGVLQQQAGDLEQAVATLTECTDDLRELDASVLPQALSYLASALADAEPPCPQERRHRRGDRDRGARPRPRRRQRSVRGGGRSGVGARLPRRGAVRRGPCSGRQVGG